MRIKSFKRVRLLKKKALIAAIILLCIGLVSAAVFSYVQSSSRSFERKGVWDTLRIIGFREVSSGPAPFTRTIAIAESIHPKDLIPEKILASHILMDPAEVSALKVGQTLQAITLPNSELPNTMLPYDYWFVTQACLERHISSPSRGIGVIMPLFFIILSLPLGIYGLRKQPDHR
jgi:hypothetical protein